MGLINNKTLWFSPDDFRSLIHNWNSRDEFMEKCAKVANDILREKLSTAYTVYGPQSFWGFTQQTQESWHTFRNPGHTHEAKLIEIREVEAGS